MKDNELTLRFISQNEQFIRACLLQMKSKKDLESLPSVLDRSPTPLSPVLIQDFHVLTDTERADISGHFQSEFGVARFVVLNSEEPSAYGHPLIEIAQQLTNELHLAYPLAHPLEEHPDSTARFGRDGTLKVYEVVKDSSAGYREQGETSELFSMHHDGLGSGGTVFTVGLYMDQPPLSGGYTYFQNICRLSLELARKDRDAFNDLFLPDAFTVIRPRGKGAIRVTSTVLYLNEDSRPQSAFRTPSGEYQILWRSDRPALQRAADFLNKHAEPFARGSTFVHLMAKGHGCFIRNEVIGHGRTRFLNARRRIERVLARKWFMRHPRDSVYKHVPGLFLAEEFASLYPEYFGPGVLEGEWLYDQQKDVNVRVK